MFVREKEVFKAKQTSISVNKWRAKNIWCILFAIILSSARKSNKNLKKLLNFLTKICEFFKRCLQDFHVHRNPSELKSFLLIFSRNKMQTKRIKKIIKKLKLVTWWITSPSLEKISRNTQTHTATTTHY